MKRFNRGRWLCATISAVMAGSAIAAPVKIQNEEQAASTWMLVSAFTHSIENEVMRGPDIVLQKVLRSMQDLDRATTPQSLLASMQGVSIPCEFGGSFTARMSRARPGELTIDWSACTQEADEYFNSTLSGPVILKLTSSSFTPECIKSLRAGTKTTNVIWTRNYTDPESPQVYEEEFNFTMRGVIPVTRLFESGYFTGEGDFTLSGSAIGTSQSLLDGYSDRSSTIVEGARVKRSTIYSDNNTVLSRSFELVKGSLVSRSESPYGAREHSFSSKNFRAREFTDYGDFTAVKQQQWIDGKVNYQYGEGFNPICVSGDYVLKTRVPMTNLSLFTKQERDEGEVVVNNSTVRFYPAANIPPNLPTPIGNMLTTIDVKHVGSFAFDSDWTSPRTVAAVSQCW